MRTIYFMLSLGLLSVSTAAIFARFLPDLPAFTIAFWRLSIASFLLWSYSSLRVKKTPVGQVKKIIMAGIALGLHFACFFQALKLTTIANATLFATMAPVFTFLYELLTPHRLAQRQAMGLLLAISGSLIIQGGDWHAGHYYLAGNLLALAASLFMAVVLILGRQIRSTTSTVAFTRWLYSYAALVLLLLVAITKAPLLPIDHSDYIWLLALGLVPTLVGHNSLNYAVKYLSPTAVAAVPLGEPVGASLLGWLIFSEAVPVTTMLGGLVVLIGVFFVLQKDRRNT